MITPDETLVMRAIAICFKPYLKPEEALICTNLGRTQFAKRCEDSLIHKTSTGYYKKEDLDRMMEGTDLPKMKIKVPGRHMSVMTNANLRRSYDKISSSVRAKVRRPVLTKYWPSRFPWKFQASTA